MARNKHPEVTRNRIVETATKLFWSKGWEETTIQDIMDALGDLTRGAFYHHFKSKTDIIEAVLDNMAAEQDPFAAVRQLKGLTGLQKLQQALRLSFEDPGQEEAMKEVPAILTEPQMIARQVVHNVNVVSRQLLQFIEEGIADGSVRVRYPEQAAETCMLLFNVWLSPVIYPVSRETYRLKTLHLKEVLDAMGLPILDEEALSMLDAFYQRIHPIVLP